MPRPDRFLPAFFAVLFVAFAIAVTVRIRSYREDRPATATATTTVAQTEAPDATVPEAMATIVEAPVDIRRNATSSPPLLDRPAYAEPASTAIQPVATAATAPPVTATAARPSLASRVIAPIVNAVRGTQGDKPPASSSQASSQSGDSSRNDNNRPSTDTTSTENNRDGTSDDLAPQLAAIEFIPPQVQDGEETTLLVIANDNLTGIQSISGTIIAPSGAIQGFACQREGETNRYQSRVTVPREAAEGTWRVNYISLLDKASNAATLTMQQGTIPQSASFRVVSSRPDSEGPVLKSVWIDKRAMRGGEKNTVFVDATDEKSGVNLITGVFQSPSKFARVGFICRTGTPWTCELTAPACSDCGDWQLEQLQLQDKANNMTTLRSGNEMVAAVHINITSDSCDATPPAIESLTLSTNRVVNTNDSNITVTATLTDDACGVLSVSGQAVGPATNGPPPRRYFSLTAAGDGRTWSGQLTIPRLASKGVWHVSFVQVLDKGHNLKTYGQGDPILVNGAFTVQ